MTLYTAEKSILGEFEVIQTDIKIHVIKQMRQSHHFRFEEIVQ